MTSSAIHSPIPFDTMLQECRDKLGPPPRRLSWLRHVSLVCSKPDWIRKDELNAQYIWQRNYLEQGVIVWGHIVVANSQLYTAGPTSHPCIVVYPDLRQPDFSDLLQLESVARLLAKLRENVPFEPDQKDIRQVLRNDFSRPEHYAVPRSIAVDHPFRICAMAVLRDHLPPPRRFMFQSYNRLILPFFPLLVQPDEPFAMILPALFWPQSLIDLWTHPRNLF